MSACPDDVKAAIDRHVRDGIEPGSFVKAVLENDLAGAFGCADLENRAALFDILYYVCNDIPSEAWGSPEKVRAWRAAREAYLLSMRKGSQP